MPKTMAQCPTIREHRQPGVPYFGAILPVLSVLGFLAMILGILEAQAGTHPRPDSPIPPKEAKIMAFS